METKCSHLVPTVFISIMCRLGCCCTQGHNNQEQDIITLEIIKDWTKTFLVLDQDRTKVFLHIEEN